MKVTVLCPQERLS